MESADGVEHARLGVRLIAERLGHRVVDRASLYDRGADALKQHAKELRAYNENVQTIEVITETVT